jgi:hypothetical protein
VLFYSQETLSGFSAFFPEGYLLFISLFAVSGLPLLCGLRHNQILQEISCVESSRRKKRKEKFDHEYST